VRIQRSVAGSGTWTDVCTDASAPYECSLNTTALANDLYELRAIAVDTAGNTTTSAVRETQVDNTPPAVSVTDPGSPLSGVLNVAAAADDADSGVAQVTVQRRLAGASAWTDLCSDTSAPYSCRWDTTTVADGLYDLRAVAADAAGNTTTSSVVSNRRVDNSISSVSLDDPGTPIRGTVTLTANASSTAGVQSVAIQRSPAGANTWTTICTDTASPWSCSFNTAAGATPDGLYDLRAVMTTGAGATLTSAVVANRRIDNAPVLGVDVQATNRSGGTPARLETGDSLSLTWSAAMNPATLVSGWNGSGSATVYVRARDGGLLGGGIGDTLDFWGNAGLTTATGLGAVTLAGDYVRSGRTVVFAATVTLATTTVNGVAATRATVTLGAVQSGGGQLRTSTVAGAMVWTPSASARDLTGSLTSTVSVTETGASDLDF
jgi:hypothetical protein